MPLDNQELHDRINNAIGVVDIYFLKKGWGNFEYRLDVCCVKEGSHIGHL
jgi:hypothetical protein